MSPYISKMPFQPFLASFAAIPLIKMVNITYKMTKNDHNLTPIFLMILYCIFFCHPKQHYSLKVYNILAYPCNIDHNIVKPFSGYGPNMTHIPSPWLYFSLIFSLPYMNFQ